MSLNTITLQYSSVRGQQKNTSYPFRKEISTPEELAEIAEFDHVCAVYADGKNTKGRMVRGYRSRKTFLEANCLPQDCDNANSNPLAPDIPPEEWKTPADVCAAFPGVPFYVVYSRNHMKEKNGKPARPKFHTYFVTRKITNTATMDALKKRVQEYFPAFDKEALDSARFLFGVENPQVEYCDGDTPLDVFMENLEKLPEQIPEGQRNGTISRYAARVFKKYGDTNEAERLVLEANETRCLPPMEDSEVQGILASARSFFHDTIEKDPNYIGPEEYAAMDFAGSGKKKPVTSEDIKEILNRMNITVRLNVLSGMVEITGMPPQYSNGAFDGVEIGHSVFFLSGSRLYIGLWICCPVYNADFVNRCNFRNGAFPLLLVKGVLCHIKGKQHLTAANVNNPEISLNPDNLEALCLACHNAEHFSAGGATAAGLAFDGDGNLIQESEEYSHD